MPYKNPEDKKANRQRYKESGRADELTKLWRANNPDRVAAYKARSWKNIYNDPEKGEEYRYKMRLYKLTRRITALVHYGGKCVCCGETRVEFLTFDHMNNDGNKDRKKNGITKVTLSIWRMTRTDIRVLCYNGNCSHGFYGYCPHERERSEQ